MRCNSVRSIQTWEKRTHIFLSRGSAKSPLDEVNHIQKLRLVLSEAARSLPMGEYMDAAALQELGGRVSYLLFILPIVS